MASPNAHKLFHDAPTQTDLLRQITIDDSVDRALREAREVIRKRLREGVKDWERLVKQQDLFDQSVTKVMQRPPALSLKFKMQGSFVYATVNDPAQLPPQQIDLDDGAFLPVGFVQTVMAARPMLASAGLFALIEEILAPLCEQRGWELDRSKASCVRVQLNETAHIDIPLYAVSDTAFAKLVEARLKDSLNPLHEDQLHEAMVLDDQIYESLGETDIRLAHRKDGWIESDPRKIEAWFRDSVQRHGEQLRRVSRYLKAWRDYVWPESKVTSILLMQCAVVAFDRMASRVSPSRDDLALLAVTSALSEQFQTNIPNPVLANQFLNDNWDAEERAEYTLKARLLTNSLQQALTDDLPAELVIVELRKVFGSRLPSDESLVEYETMDATVRAYAPARVPQPQVRRSTSG